MKSALEYFLYAAKCEELAQAAANDVDRKSLLERAQRWRKLGNDAKSREAEANPKRRKPPKTA